MMLMLLSTSSCTNMSCTQQGALSGGAIGAGAGLGISALTGHKGAHKDKYVPSKGLISGGERLGMTSGLHTISMMNKEIEKHNLLYTAQRVNSR